jgi:hypothetical protein
MKEVVKHGLDWEIWNLRGMRGYGVRQIPPMCLGGRNVEMSRKAELKTGVCEQ